MKVSFRRNLTSACIPASAMAVSLFGLPVLFEVASVKVQSATSAERPTSRDLDPEEVMALPSSNGADIVVGLT